MDYPNERSLSPLKVFKDYVVIVTANSQDAVCGQIWHIVPSATGNGCRTPVGLFLAFVEEPSELRPLHWQLELFLRSDLHYDQDSYVTHVVTNQNTLSDQPRFHPDLPRAIGEALLANTFCTEPMAAVVSLFRNIDVAEFGNTWIDEDDE